MDWLLLVGLGVVWVAFLLPSLNGRKAVSSSPSTTVEEFEHNMDLLAETDGSSPSPDPGRRVLSPRKGERFVGTKARERARIRDRRRRVLVALSEATGLTFLIGLVPPLRSLWAVTAILGVALLGYVWLLVRLKDIESGKVEDRRAAAAPVQTTHYQAAALQYSAGQRYVAQSTGNVARASYAGLSAMGEGEDQVHVVVRPT